MGYHIDFNELIFRTLAEMLEQREDIRQAEVTEDISEIRIEAEPLQELKFYCPLKIMRETDEPFFNDDEYEEGEEVSSEYAVYYADEINHFLKNEYVDCCEGRGLMKYFDENSVLSERIFSANISVDNINGTLMGVTTVQTVGKLTESETDELRDYLIGQMSDGAGESIKQHSITVSDFNEIYVSFWNSGDDCSLQTKEEFISRAEEIQPDMTM